jgi:hypothetical protein
VRGTCCAGLLRSHGQDEEKRRGAYRAMEKRELEQRYRQERDSDAFRKDGRQYMRLNTKRYTQTLDRGYDVLTNESLQGTQGKMGETASQPASQPPRRGGRGLQCSQTAVTLTVEGSTTRSRVRCLLARSLCPSVCCVGSVSAPSAPAAALLVDAGCIPAGARGEDGPARRLRAVAAAEG